MVTIRLDIVPPLTGLQCLVVLSCVAQVTLITSCRSVADLPASGLNLRAEKSVGFAKVGRMVSPSFTLGALPSRLLRKDRECCETAGEDLAVVTRAGQVLV